MIPVFDFGNFTTWIMRGLSLALKINVVLFLYNVIKNIFGFFMKPLGLFAVVTIIQWNPTVVRNLLYYIGLWTIETAIGFYKFFYDALVSNDNELISQVNSEVTEVFELAKAGLPDEWIQLIQTLDIIPLVGIIVSTVFYIVIIRIVYSAVSRADFRPNVLS